MTILRIRIKGFKSLEDITLDGLSSYSVFAGPNGAGKSNWVDALDFFATVIDLGVEKALRKFGGYNQIINYKNREKTNRIIGFEIEVLIDGKRNKYIMDIHDIDVAPKLEEYLFIQGETIIDRRKNGIALTLKGVIEDGDYINASVFIPDDRSLIQMVSRLPLWNYLRNIRVFRFDPVGAKEPSYSSADTSELDLYGRNLASMLSVLEKDAGFRSQILEWLELIVPGMEQVSTERQNLDGSTILTFKEEGIKERFPAHLISDGTIYALCIMTAVLSRSKQYGMTIIEEPERGIHPKAIGELVSFMRDNATTEHPVFVTTHSESVVRASTKEELWLVNKSEGRTAVKNAAKQCGDLGDLNLDKAWLMNFFDGGLPW